MAGTWARAWAFCSVALAFPLSAAADYYAETEADRFYMIVVRLSDEDLGNRLRVTAN